MIKLPNFDPVEYLVLRRFPSARALRLPPSLLFRGGQASADGLEHCKKLLDEINAYENELKSKTSAELKVLLDQERAKEAAELSARAAREEQQRFFNQAHAQADFEHWSKAATGPWTRPFPSHLGRRRSV
jgi:hypothetical protein